MTLRFTLDGTFNRTRRGWAMARERGRCTSALGTARKFARLNDVAGVWSADDSFILFYRDGGKIRQKTWPSATPVAYPQPGVMI